MKECPRCGKCCGDAQVKCPEDQTGLVQTLSGPQVIDGKYQLEKCLGCGGMGVVYQAVHIDLGKVVAVKLILPGRRHEVEFLDRFRTEARALGCLNHPNIVGVSDFGVDSREGGVPYLIMEYLAGPKLTSMVSPSGLSFEEIQPILQGIADALDYAHEAGVIHRDLKPDNVMLVRSAPDAPPQIKVLDFGLARFIQPVAAAHRELEPGVGDGGSKVEEAGRPSNARLSAAQMAASLDSPVSTSEAECPPLLTIPGRFMCTAAYMAPELVEGPVGPAADVYSFAVLAYELLTGRPVFGGTDEEQIEQHVKALPVQPSVVNSAVPRQMDQPLLRALAKDPAQRPPRSGLLMAELTAASAQSRSDSWRRRQRPRQLGMSAASTLAALVLAGLVSLLPVVDALESKIGDSWFLFSPVHPMDERIAIITLPDNFWQANGTADADDLAAGLEHLFDAGVRGVALDLILPARFSRSSAFAKLVLMHRSQLALSAMAVENGELKGMECLDGYVHAALDQEKLDGLFGLVSVEEDSDGLIRHYRLVYPDASGARRPALGAKCFEILTGRHAFAEAVREIGVDFTVDWPRRVFKWTDLSVMSSKDLRSMRGKLVLVGGEPEFFEDIRPVPHPRSLPDRVSGVVVHAMALNTLLQNRSIERGSGFFLYCWWGGCAAVGALALFMMRRLAHAAVVVAAAVTVHAPLSLLLFMEWRKIIPVITPVLAVSVVSVIGFVFRRWFFKGGPDD